MEKQKKRAGDRKDGVLLRDLDALHFITGVIYPNRCDNEAYISERIDLTNIYAYLERKNADSPAYKYNLFQVIVASLMKTVTLRPKLNRFIANSNFYQRNKITAAFIVKKLFDDNGGEALALLNVDGNTTIDTLHEDIYKKVSTARGGSGNSTEDTMDIMNKLPRWISKTAIKFLMFLDRHGWVPESFISDDPYYASVLFSNLGSIKMNCGYHHLTNWGTCSLFCIIGEVKNTAFPKEDGTFEMRPTVQLGITLDERLADGYYYSKSIRLLKYLMEHPETLELPFETEVTY